MRIFLTVLWHFPFFGFLSSFFYLLMGFIQCLTIVFIPLGLGVMQVGLYLLNPFHTELVRKEDLALVDPSKETSTFMVVFNLIIRILYFIPGCFAALSVTLMTLACFLSIIGIPCGLVWMRVIPSAFNPINKVCVSTDVADMIRVAKATKRG